MKRPIRRRLLWDPSIAIVCATIIGTIFVSMSTTTADEPVVFNRDIRPILSDKCLHCHGADETSRKAELRLDDAQDVSMDRGGYRVIVAGNPRESELFRRITSDDADERMPPADNNKQLMPEETEVIRRWIQQGAKYQDHWSFISPVRPNVPAGPTVQTGNEIDYFVRAQLKRQALTAASGADRATLLRRVSLDLTGLPPTPQELDAFLADDSVRAYETVVDRLLNSQRYGEHFARYWLDAARYADSNGYFTDEGRTMWPWRDWVIRAFNDNMPFDKFTVAQLAGDLLPDANLEHKVASGFNRNHMINNETGIDTEEFRVEYVVDRVKTTGTVWMGLTIGCARCHDHKFDPISQRDFYRLFAFFNNVPEKGMDGSKGNAAPLLRLPTPDQQRQLAAIDATLAAAKRDYVSVDTALRSGQHEWEEQAVASTLAAPTRGLLVHFPLDHNANGFGPQEVKGRAPNDVSFGDGAVGGALELHYGKPVEAQIELPINSDKPFSLGAWARPEKNAGCIISQTDDTKAFRGFDLSLRKGRMLFHLIHRWKDDAIEVSTAATISAKEWQHLFVTYDGSGKAGGVKLFVDGRPRAVRINVDNLHGDITTDEPLRIGRRKASASFEGSLDDVRLYDRVLSEEEVFALATGQLIRGTVSRPADKRDPSLARKLADYYARHHAPEADRSARDQLSALQKERDNLYDAVPVTMVMQEMDRPRDAFLLERGVHDQHGEVVTAGIPASLGVFPKGQPLNRLGLARWLTSPEHPLTARVTVNRIWQQCFGTGIVSTTEDFGTQGAWPSHPELLDWLAVEFVESGWDVKHLVRLIVLSATYRQTSNATPAQFTADPLNRTLSRGPRFRLDAEALRDQALAISGLLAEKIGGPSVKPYQPPGLWQAVSFDGNASYELSSGPDLHRRSLYSFWKRQAPPPNMLVFDAGTRETCGVRRSRTNTPLQALVLMNDPVFIEAAEHLARRTLTESPTTSAAARARFAFRLATARFPKADEIEILTTLHEKQLARFQANPKAAEQLLTSTRGQLPLAEAAAWTAVCNLILSLDETITKR